MWENVTAYIAEVVVTKNIKFMQLLWENIRRGEKNSIIIENSASKKAVNNKKHLKDNKINNFNLIISSIASWTTKITVKLNIKASANKFHRDPIQLSETITNIEEHKPTQ